MPWLVLFPATTWPFNLHIDASSAVACMQLIYVATMALLGMSKKVEHAAARSAGTVADPMPCPVAPSILSYEYPFSL